MIFIIPPFFGLRVKQFRSEYVLFRLEPVRDPLFEVVTQYGIESQACAGT